MPVLTALTTAMPAAVTTTVGPSKSLPIHIACTRNAPLLAIEHLVSLHPESLHIPDSEGNLPIHLACSVGEESVVTFLASVSPESVRMTNSKLQMPLHLACNRYNISIGVVELLLMRYPQAAKHKDWQHQVPLHKAVTWRANVGVLGALLNVVPDATRFRDKRSLTPYKIGRKLLGFNSDDPTIKLLRRYRCKHGMFAFRIFDAVLFSIENVRDKVLPTKRSRTARAS